MLHVGRAFRDTSLSNVWQLVASLRKKVWATTTRSSIGGSITRLFLNLSQTIFFHWPNYAQLSTPRPGFSSTLVAKLFHHGIVNFNKVLADFGNILNVNNIDYFWLKNYHIVIRPEIFQEHDNFVSYSSKIIFSRWCRWRLPVGWYDLLWEGQALAPILSQMARCLSTLSL